MKTLHQKVTRNVFSPQGSPVLVYIKYDDIYEETGSFSEVTGWELIDNPEQVDLEFIDNEILYNAI